MPARLCGALLAFALVALSHVSASAQYVATTDGQLIAGPNGANCNCAMCDRARDAIAAGQKSFCWMYRGKRRCFSIKYVEPPDAARKAPNVARQAPNTAHQASNVARPASTWQAGFKLNPGETLSKVYPPGQSPKRVAKSPEPPAAVDPVTAFDPTPEDAVAAGLNLLGIEPGDMFVDPFGGDGRTAIAAAKLGARAFVVEINPKTAALARKRSADVGNVTVIEGSAFDDIINYRSVDAVYLYAYGPMMHDLLPQLRQLRRGAKVVSYCHDIPDVCTDRVKVGDHVFYVWSVGVEERPTWISNLEK
ncbi:MAG: class I SAM-dependent methyltransferase [Planctomycetota bacterium]